MRTFLKIKLVLEISTKINMVTFLTNIQTQKTKDIETFDITYATSTMILYILQLHSIFILQCFEILPF